MINPFTGIPSTNKSLSSEDKLQLLDDDKWIFELASKLNIPAAGGNSGGGGGGAVDSVNGQTGTVVLDSDDISEGTTNLYSQWEDNIYFTSYHFLQPKSTQGLLIGPDLHSSLSTFNSSTAFFNGDPLSVNNGTNYFMNLSYGSNLLTGALFVGGQAKGTPSAPTQNTGGFVSIFTGTAYSGSAWEIQNASHVLPGMYIYSTGNVTTPNGFNSKVWLGSALGEMISVNLETNAIQFNVPQVDSDITFFYDSGTAMAIDGGTGNITAGALSGTTANSLANIDTAQTFTNKRVTPRVSTTTSSATPTINTDNVDVYGLTAQTADITSFTTNLSGTPTNGQKLWIYVVGTAARAITWGSSFENGPSTLPTTTVGTERLDVGFVWNAVSSKWRCVAAGSA